MYIYFCGSIRGGRQDVQIYQTIVKKLQTFGKVLTEHVSHNEVTDKGDPDAETVGDKFIHDRDLEWLTMADVIVAEVTQPSLGVGYELGRAVAMKKRTLCLFRPSSGRSLSAMIRGAQDGHVIQVMDYDPQQIEDLLDQYFNTLNQSPEGHLK